MFVIQHKYSWRRCRYNLPDAAEYDPAMHSEQFASDSRHVAAKDIFIKTLSIQNSRKAWLCLLVNSQALVCLNIY